jgi:hypothetical protein
MLTKDKIQTIYDTMLYVYDKKQGYSKDLIPTLTIEDKGDKFKLTIEIRVEVTSDTERDPQYRKDDQEEWKELLNWTIDKTMQVNFLIDGILEAINDLDDEGCEFN